MVDRPRRAGKRARLAPVHPRRAPPRRDARVRVGWDTEYPRDIWRLCNLGIDQPEATISFAAIPQPWLKELAKRYTRWQLATGLSASTAGSGARAVTRFAAWLACLPDPPNGLAGMTRPVLERYLAVLQAEMGGQVRHSNYVGGLSGFLKAVRRHGWDGTLPGATAIYPEDFPPRGAGFPAASPPTSWPRSSSPPTSPGRTTRPAGSSP